MTFLCLSHTSGLHREQCIHSGMLVHVVILFHLSSVLIVLLQTTFYQCTTTSTITEHYIQFILLCYALRISSHHGLCLVFLSVSVLYLYIVKLEDSTIIGLGCTKSLSQIHTCTCRYIILILILLHKQHKYHVLIRKYFCI